MFGKAKFPIQIWNCRFRLAIFNFEKLDFQNYLTGPGFETASFLYNLLFNLCCASVGKIFSDLDENSPLGVVFCVDHESDVNFLIRDRDQG